MAVKGTIQQQFKVSGVIALRLKALLVAAACYSGLDLVLYVPWLVVFPLFPAWLIQLLSFIFPPLFTAVMALILARLSAPYAVSNSLVASTVVVLFLLMGIINEEVRPALHHWIHYLHTFSPILLIIFIFPMVAIIWQQHTLGPIRWPEQLAVVHVGMALCLIIALSMQYRWLAENELFSRITNARVVVAQGAKSACVAPCRPIEILLTGGSLPVRHSGLSNARPVR